MDDPEVDMLPLPTFSSVSSETNLFPALGVTYKTSPFFNLRLDMVEVLINFTSRPGLPFMSFLTTKSSSVFIKALICDLRLVPLEVVLICKRLRPSEDRIPSVIWFRDILTVCLISGTFFLKLLSFFSRIYFGDTSSHSALTTSDLFLNVGSILIQL